MNLPQLAADLAARVPEMAKDSPTNNAELIQGILSDEELIRRRECPRCAELKARLQMQTAEQINGPQIGRIDVKTSDERDEDQRIEIAELKAQLDAANKACAEMRDALESFRKYDSGLADLCSAERPTRLEHALSTSCGKGYASKEQVKVLRDALVKINDSERWSCEVTTGLLMKEKDGPWVMVDHDAIQQALSSTKDLQ